MSSEEDSAQHRLIIYFKSCCSGDDVKQFISFQIIDVNSAEPRWAKDNDMKNEFPYGFKEWLLGKISFVYSIDHKVGKKMLEQYNAIIWGF